MVKGGRLRVLLSKPIFAGFAILELSKLLIYQFHHYYIKKTYEDRVSLMFTDMGSLMYHIRTDDLYAMKKDSRRFDTSNFELFHSLYSEKYKKVVGKFKVETGSLLPCPDAVHWPLSQTI